MKIITLLIALALALPAQVIIAKKKAAGGSPPAYSACAAGDDAGGSGTTQATSSTLNVPTGASIYCGVGFSTNCASDTFSVTDGGSNSLTGIGTPYSIGNGQCSQVFKKDNATANATATFTMTVTSAVSYKAISCVVVTGTNTTDSLSSSPSPTEAIDTTITSSSITASSSELALAFLRVSSFTTTITPDTGWIRPAACESTYNISTMQHKTGSISGTTTMTTNVARVLHISPVVLK